MHVRLLHENGPSHTSELVKQYLKSEKVTFLSNPPFSPDLASYDFFFIFQKLKKFLSSRRYKSWQVLDTSIIKCLRSILNQRNVTHFRNGFRYWTRSKVTFFLNFFLACQYFSDKAPPFQNDATWLWNYVSQTAENTLKGCNVNFIISFERFWDVV